LNIEQGILNIELNAGNFMYSVFISVFDIRYSLFDIRILQGRHANRS